MFFKLLHSHLYGFRTGKKMNDHDHEASTSVTKKKIEMTQFPPHVLYVFIQKMQHFTVSFNYLQTTY